MIRKFSYLACAVLPLQVMAGTFGPLLTPDDGAFPDCCAIHVIHVTGGDFLMWGNANQGGTTTNSWTWNAFTGQFSDSPITIGEDVFCCGVSQLPDGRPIITGGNMDVGFGITHTFIFNLSTRQWNEVDQMSSARWYPTLAILSDGTPTAISGWSTPDNQHTHTNETDWVERVDVFNIATETWTDFMPAFDLGPGVDMQPHFYPFMIPYYDAALPNAIKLFFAGRATVGHEEYSVPYGFNTYSLNFSSTGTSATWKPLGGDSDMQGSGAVMMIGRTDPIDAGTVYKFGGVRFGVLMGRGMKIDLNNPLTAIWTATIDMPSGQERAECNVQALADGRIALIGGTTATEYHSLANTGVNNIIIYNPATDTYDEISPNFSGTRMYHSTAIPSPTGTIFMAGGEYKEDAPPHDHKSNKTAQEYYPDYFGDGSRPLITSAPGYQSWNTTMTVTARGAVDHFSLLKLSSTTHANDMTQRYIKMTYAATPTGGTYQLKMPKNGAIAPPGVYMLFAVSPEGFPSVAKYVSIGIPQD